MRSYLICNNQDTLLGMRLAGIEGIIVGTKEKTLEVLDTVMSDNRIGIVIITEKILAMAEDEIMKLKLERDSPLILAIPDKDKGQREDYIAKYIRESVGIKI